jgi:hypothetical protein
MKLKLIKELIALKEYNEEIERIDEKALFNEIKIKKEYKNKLRKEKKITEDFHSNRDLYYYIRGIASRVARLGTFDELEVKNIINDCIERNFGGIEYEIDIDFNSTNDDIMKSIKAFKKIIEDYELYKENEIILLNSVFLFKQLYNSQFEKDPNNSLKIETTKINDYNLNSCINSNIRDFHSRYLLLQVSPTLTTLIYQNIKLQNQLIDIELYDGSPFIDDNNKEYRFKKINQIQDDAKSEKLIIIQNLDQIHPFLYDLYNKNYIVKDEKNFARVCLDDLSEQLTLVNDRFRIIILVDRRFIRNVDMSLLQRLEKMIITFDKLLDNEQKLLTEKIFNEINLIKYIETYNKFKHIKINYSLEN